VAPPGGGGGAAGRACTQAAAAPIEFEIINLVADETGNVNVDDAINSLRRNKVGLKGTPRRPARRDASGRHA